MHYKQIIRVGSDGAVEKPWRNRKHQFVLGDPRHGQNRHHDELAIKVETYGESLELVQKGLSIRMSDGRRPASLVSAGSLQLIDEPVRCLDELWTYTIPVPPFTLDDVLRDWRATIIAQTCRILNVVNQKAAEFFSGLDLQDVVAAEHCDPENLDLGRFLATRVIMEAYHYAFGTRPGAYLSDEDVDELEVLLELISGGPTNRFYSPLDREDSPLRVALEMAYARWQLREGSDLTVSRLAFLARMTESAVRNSLSKERIRPENGLIPYRTALAWLESRRDFLPQRESERANAADTWAALHVIKVRPPAAALDEIARRYGGNQGTLTTAAEIAATVENGHLPRQAELRRFASELGLAPDTFVVEALTIWETDVRTSGKVQDCDSP